MRKKLAAICLVVTMLTALFIQPVVFADFQPELPSLYKTFRNYFKFGIFHSMNTYTGTGVGNQIAKHHYNSWAPSNEFKPQYLFNANASAQAYNAAVNATYDSPEEREAAIDKANRTVVLSDTTSQENFLRTVRALNETRAPEDQVKVKCHTLLWHNMTPEEFFRDGFSRSNGWASPDVMLDRIDSYIKQVFERFAPYKDVIYAWDVVNEAVDCFTGYIRNESDYQLSNWGRIFKRPDLTGDERLLAESVYIRQAFESASKYNKQYDLNWILVYNDFHDADKPYEPKVTATITMLRPIYEKMKEDGTTFAIGMQNRNATSLDLEVFKDTYNRFAEICDLIQMTESDVRCDLVPNQNYDPKALPYYLDNGSKNPEWTWENWQRTPEAHVALVADGWQASWANKEEYQRAQADWMADQFDFMLENSVGNGGKIETLAYDGLNDSQTFNSNKGAHFFMAADSAGNTNYTAKMSYYAMIGSAARFELKKALENVPEESEKDKYTSDSWDRLAQAVEAANDILEVRIYDLNGVNNVIEAKEELLDALEDLTDNEVALSEIKINDQVLEGFSPGIHEYNVTVSVGTLPQVSATAADPNATVTITQATAVPGSAVITVKSGDGSKQVVYTIYFDIASTLNSLNIDGRLISGFDPNVFTYDVVVPYGSVPNVTAVAKDPGATVEITQATEVPGQAKVVVTAGTEVSTYTINFKVDTKLKALKVNGLLLEGFSPDTYNYRAVVPEGMTMIPQVSVLLNDPNIPVTITQADGVPGEATVEVGKDDWKAVYTVKFLKYANGNDEFDKPTLDTSLWSWINEDPSLWSLTANPGYMTLSSRQGDLYQASTDAKNILLQDAPGDWTIETKLTCTTRPDAAYEQGGIIVFQDMDNYMKLDWEAQSSTRTIIQVLREVNGSPSATSITANDIVGPDNTVWFRIVKNGNVYSAYYSVDGENFTQVGTDYTLNFQNVKVGIYANNGSGTSEDMDVMFDYFHSTAKLGVMLPKALPPVSIDPIEEKKPGEKVTISGINSIGEVSIQVIAPDNTLLYFDVVKGLEYSSTFALPENAKEGTYTVIVGKGSTIATTTFEVVKTGTYIVTTTFTPDKMIPYASITANVTVQNVDAANEPVLAIVALYDANNRMVNVAYISKVIAKGETETLKAGFKMPADIAGHVLKVYVWDGEDLESSAMNPLSNVVSLYPGFDIDI
ncbi:MAG: DUF1349 domain-containing protein [Clostridiaceae bacterium]|nr:DUF1349 domain-containing protein [Clostridiaceae bacterium]